MRLIDADKLIRETILNPLHIPYITKRDVENAPTVYAKPAKRGKWLTCDDGWGGVHYQCSVCGNEWYLEDGTPEENGMNYCPHCGAKMREGEKDA